MIEKMECTDCKHCASFWGDYRLYCTHPDFPAEEVCDYEPIGDGDAEECSGFEFGEPSRWGRKDIDAYEEYSDSIYDDVTYEGIREWIDIQMGRK